MKKYSMILFALLACGIRCPGGVRADGAGAAPEPTNWVAITSGFAMAIASAACGLAQARATASACEGMARNPGAAADSIRADSGAGADRVDGAVHLCHHLRQG